LDCKNIYDKHYIIKLKIQTVFVLIFFIAFFSTPILYGQNLTEKSDKVIPLFESEEPLRFTLITDIKKIRNDESDNPEYSEAKLILYTDSVTNIEFDIEAKARGNSRRLFDFCAFPPIKLNFKKKDVIGTVFEGQDKLKLVAYCKDADLFEDYVLQEYLIYKVYNCLTPYSFKVRLAEITYKDTDEKVKEVVRYGFLIEDDDLMAERNGGKITELILSNHDRCDRDAIDMFTIFQYMIGNTDWWIASPIVHNGKLIYIEGHLPIPVPYDFDYCGAINTNYAVPPEELPIKSVRERYFRGYCRLPGTYEKTVAKFIDSKECIYDIYNNFPFLDDSRKKYILKYYDDFYYILDDPKRIERAFYKSCQLNHTHLYK
jgi:hypothetical protein